MTLQRRTAWIFDMDGTLTVAVHDFAGMRQQLSIPGDISLLDGMRALPPGRRAEAEAVVEAWEWEHAERSRPAPGVVELLDALRDAGAHVGVLTRNLRPIALRTLAVAGLDAYLDPDDVLGRTCAEPKPAPDGVLHLLARWGRTPDDAVMIGDHLHDAAAGRAAGAHAIVVNGAAPAAWADVAHAIVPDLHAVLRAWQP